MPAKDIFHDNVKNALIKDGWNITDDLLKLQWGNKDLYVDLGAENNNQIITSSSQLYTSTTSGSTDGRWQIRADSEFLTAGKGGTEPGPFGGIFPYELSGVPNIPIIYELITTGFATDSEGLPVTIGVKSN